MTKNIFKGAEFGDKFVTVDHRTATYLGEWKSRYFDKTSIIYKCWIEGTEEPIEYNESGEVYNMSKCIFDDGTIESFGEDIFSRCPEPSLQIRVDEDILRGALHNFISENFTVHTSDGDYDYGEQTIEYWSDRTHKDSKNVDLYAISDDFIDYYHKEKEK